VAISLALAALVLGGGGDLERGFRNPPPEAKLRAYWWWLNGNVTKESIKRDLDEMAAKGFGGAVLVDAGGAEQRGNDQVPHGPTFFSPEWRELYKYAIREAKRQHLELSLNIQSGWNLGGPMVPAKDAPKKLVWTEQVVGPDTPSIKLAEPKHDPALYGDVAVVAYPVANDYDPAKRNTLKDWQQKALLQPLSFSAPKTDNLLADDPDAPGEEAGFSTEVQNLTIKMTPDGTLSWKPAAGKWEVLRIGYTLNDHCRVSTCSQGWDGFAIDPFDRGAFDRYWNEVVEPLIADAGADAGKTLKYLHTDSWEVEVANWTPTLFAEFKKRRGYDLLPFLPVLTGRILDGRRVSDQVLYDLRRTMGDLAIDNHYRPFKEYAHKHGLLIHPESGGPHAVPIDSLQCLGYNDAPMSEFWAGSWTHRVKEEDRFFVKQPASAAHTYGHQYVLAEGFTTIGPHWQETIWDNLKPNFDEACCQGMNRLVWHAFVCSPNSTGVPGQQYFAGTHLNPKVTWWAQSTPFLTYLNRCQFMLQQGRFVADALYYYGDHVPNFAQLKKSDPAGVLPGYDYDVATQENVLSLHFEGGQLTLPSGMSYRLLVLPNRDSISLPVLRKVAELVNAGAQVVGPRPIQPTSRLSGPDQREFVRLVTGVWDKVQPPTDGHHLLERLGVSMDFQVLGTMNLDYIHRRTSGEDIYFVANRAVEPGGGTCIFRTAGRVPELWDPMTGSTRPLTDWKTLPGGRTSVQLEFSPYGSCFVVFRKAGSPPKMTQPNFATFEYVKQIRGPWTVRFDPRLGGPASAVFSSLTDWSVSEDPRIRYYSGTATYETTFDTAVSSGETSTPQVWLDLGDVRELAEVTLNGKSLGVVWAPPFRVNVTGLLKPAGNRLVVKVTNFWPNRIIGDAIKGTHFTQTNIRQLTAQSPLMRSGLIGPVTISVGQAR